MLPNATNQPKSTVELGYMWDKRCPLRNIWRSPFVLYLHFLWINRLFCQNVFSTLFATHNRVHGSTWVDPLYYQLLVAKGTTWTKCGHFHVQIISQSSVQRSSLLIEWYLALLHEHVQLRFFTFKVDKGLIYP